MSLAQSLESFKSPPDPQTLKALKRRSSRGVKVLDEDEYVEKVEKIVERDFFPELESLKAQTEYMDAAERKDEVSMSRLREKFSSTASSRKIPSRDPFDSPFQFDTPNEYGGEPFTPSTLGTPRIGLYGDSREEDDRESVKSFDPKPEEKVSLDKFLRTHTSEDNENFREIIDDFQKEFRQNHSWLFKKDEVLSIEHKNSQLALPSIESQAKNEFQEKKTCQALDGWTYKNVNHVFYPPEGVPFTHAELVEQAKKEKQIIHENTRFTSNPWKTEVPKNDTIQTPGSRRDVGMGKVGIDGKEIVDPSKTPRVNGYSLLRITDPAPMVAPDESPLMTWGEIESTPYRLEGCETPLLPVYRGDGPSFNIQEVPKRDRLAHELAEKNSKYHRDKKEKAIQKARSQIKTPMSSASLTTRMESMSPAAMRLATSKLGVRLGTDKSIKSRYTPSPMSLKTSFTPSPMLSRTPKISSRSNISSSVKLTPKGPTNLPGTPILSKTSDQPSDSMKFPSRSRASDYF